MGYLFGTILLVTPVYVVLVAGWVLKNTPISKTAQTASPVMAASWPQRFSLMLD